MATNYVNKISRCSVVTKRKTFSHIRTGRGQENIDSDLCRSSIGEITFLEACSFWERYRSWSYKRLFNMPFKLRRGCNSCTAKVWGLAFFSQGLRSLVVDWKEWMSTLPNEFWGGYNWVSHNALGKFTERCLGSRCGERSFARFDTPAVIATETKLKFGGEGVLGASRGRIN